jgi:HK97 family phage portal protein
MRAFVSGGRWVKSTPNTTWSTPMSTSSEALADMLRSNDFATMYRRQLWVYAAVNKLALAEARLPFKAYRKTSDGRVPLEPDHYLSRLLRNPHPRLPLFTIARHESSMRDLNGRALIRLRRDSGGLIVALEPIHPTRIRKNDQGDKWIVTLYAGGTEEVSLDDILPRSSFSPSTSIDATGVSPLEPLRATLELEHAQKTATSMYWQRGARPGFVLKHPKSLSEPAQARLGSQFDALHGGAGNAGRTLVLEEGLEAMPLIINNVDSQYIDSRKLNREEVCAGFDTDPMVLHILDRATFGNVEEMLRGFYRDTMAPRLTEKQAFWNLMVEREFQDKGDPIYVESVMDDVLRGDPEKRIEAMAKGVQFGLLTPNEGRAAENRATLGPVGDQAFMNSTMLPVTALTAARVPQAAVRSVLGRLGRIDDLAKVDVTTLTRGLDEELADLVGYELVAAGDVGDFRRRVKSLLAD